jgi:L-threonylcarbamoyladenylate synthase
MRKSLVPPTLRLRPDAEGIATAASLLQQGEVVAFPTETVYGLGGNGLDAEAVGRIFEAKGRPAEDPLIVHLPSTELIGQVASVFPDEARLLAARFWPGPLTMVLPKLPAVPDRVTAGLGSVGVRVPSHPLAQALLRAAGLPLAAPSANLFSRPSPTSAQHVLDDLDGRIAAVLNGGATEIGVESTIVDLANGEPRILRAGGVSQEALEETLARPVPFATGKQAGPQVAPGLLEVHYSPRTPLMLIEGEPAMARQRLGEEIAKAVATGERVGVLLLAEDRELAPPGVAVELMGSWEDPGQSATRLYGALRSLDRQGLERLLVRDLAPATGLGAALADRLRRASRRLSSR